MAYYEATYGVSRAVTVERLASQVMGQGVQSTLEARYGNAIAGVSFNNVSGEWEVDATASVPSGGLAATFARTGLAGEYQVSRVSYTATDVAGTAAALTQRLQDLIDQGVVSVTNGAGQVSVTVSDTASPSDDAAVTAAEQAVAVAPSAAPVTQESAPAGVAAQPTSLSCTASSGGYCNTLVAGDAYTGSNGGLCTMSWYGSLQINGGTQPLMLTAGHCTNDLGGAGSDVYSNDLSNTVEIGQTYLGSFGGDGDWGYIYPTSPPPSGLDPGLGRPYGGYYNWSTSTLTRLQYFYSSGVPSNGTVVCHNGWASLHYLGHGTQCGTAAGTTSVGVTGTSTTLDDMLLINSTEECYGDSGGPWDLSSNATAVAIQSLASIPKGQNCGTTAWATPVSSPLQAYSQWHITLYGG